jgi:hypothetical protein
MYHDSMATGSDDGSPLYPGSLFGWTCLVLLLHPALWPKWSRSLAQNISKTTVKLAIQTRPLVCLCRQGGLHTFCGIELCIVRMCQFFVCLPTALTLIFCDSKIPKFKWKIGRGLAITEVELEIL